MMLVGGWVGSSAVAESGIGEPMEIAAASLTVAASSRSLVIGKCVKCSGENLSLCPLTVSEERRLEFEVYSPEQSYLTRQPLNRGRKTKLIK